MSLVAPDDTPASEQIILKMKTYATDIHSLVNLKLLKDVLKFKMKYEF
jgi:hypothetical protein